MILQIIILAVGIIRRFTIAGLASLFIIILPLQLIYWLFIRLGSVAASHNIVNEEELMMRQECLDAQQQREFIKMIEVSMDRAETTPYG